MGFELENCTKTLLSAIADKKMRQKEISSIYALALVSSEKTDYKVVNKAIIERWSFSGLEKIKTGAWEIIGRPERRSDGVAC